jgi:poly(A) polymerase/tRNA nucleotidyltransferase (CCA-adding enzyme)
MDRPAQTIARPAFLDDPALGAVMDALPEARVVGGAVRDALAGRAISDVDLATPRLPDEVTRALAAAGLRAVPTGLDHGTVTAISGHRGFEVTTLRHDVETDGRHAVVRYTDDFREDAARRDFSINAMSMNRAGEVFDYFGGIADLRAGKIRFVGDATERVTEDFLRILRFFRFHARYGRGAPDDAAIAAIRAGVPGMSRLSVERIWSELKRIFVTPEPDATVALMAELGVLQAVLPEASMPLSGTLARLPADPILRLAALRPTDPPALANRLKFSAAERDRLVALAAPALPDDSDDAALRRALADASPDILAGRARLAGRDKNLVRRLESMPVPVFPLHGRDLLAAGIAPGPAVGEILRELRALWLEGGCVMTEEDLRRELARRKRR